jgi:hypothetical protein
MPSKRKSKTSRDVMARGDGRVREILNHLAFDGKGYHDEEVLDPVLMRFGLSGINNISSRTSILRFMVTAECLYDCLLGVLSLDYNCQVCTQVNYNVHHEMLSNLGESQVYTLATARLS